MPTRYDAMDDFASGIPRIPVPLAGLLIFFVALARALASALKPRNGLRLR